MSTTRARLPLEVLICLSWGSHTQGVVLISFSLHLGLDPVAVDFFTVTRLTSSL